MPSQGSSTPWLSLTLGFMALWMTAVLVLACLGGFITPSPVRGLPRALKELIEELSNITQDQRVSNTHSFPGRGHKLAGSGLLCMMEEAPSYQAQK